jgi:hypothetical protein
MNDDLDTQLREALKAVDAPPGFTERVMARVASGQQRRPRWRWRIPAGLAASALLGLGIYVQSQQLRLEREGLKARREVIEALRLTDEKLDLAVETVQETSGT